MIDNVKNLRRRYVNHLPELDSKNKGAARVRHDFLAVDALEKQVLRFVYPMNGGAVHGAPEALRSMTRLWVGESCGYGMLRFVVAGD